MKTSSVSFKILVVVLFMQMKGFLFAQHLVIPLWNNGVPNTIEATNFKEKLEYENNEVIRIKKVSNPTLTVYLPKKNKANGVAVVICPGGGYAHLSFKKEGSEVAKWLNSFGVTAFVLKYRLPHDSIMEDKRIGSLQDAQEAIRTVRRHAVAWRVKPDKIGIMGFSAGGHLAALLSTQYNRVIYQNDTLNARPDFSILIYPVISMEDSITHKGSKTNLLGENPDLEEINLYSTEKQVHKETPPAFIVHATDDRSVSVENSLAYYNALLKYHIPATLHIFEKGGHGFGLKLNGAPHPYLLLLQKWLETKAKE